MTGEKEFQQAFFEDFHRQLEEQRQNCRYTDVELHVQGKVLHCHRVVLEAASPYFRAMFASGMKEDASGIVELKDLEVETVQLAVNFMYRGTCDLDEERAESLIHISDLFQILPLKKKCEKLLVGSVADNNCIQRLKLANLYRLSKLKKVALSWILEEFMSLFYEAEILDLTCEELIEVIKQDDLNIETENPVFDLVARWVNHNVDSRSKHMPELLRFIRLPHCSKSYLLEVAIHSPIMSEKCCAAYLKEATSFQACSVKQHTIWNERTRPRDSFRISQKLVVVGGMSHDSVNEQHYILEVSNRSTWKKVRQDQIYSTICAVPGGILDISRGKLCNFNKKQDEEFSDPQDEESPGLVYHDSKVYSIGGIFNGKTIIDVYVSEFENPEWNDHSDLPIPLSQSAAVSHGQEIFVFGGLTSDSQPSCKVYALDVLQRKWQERQDMPELCSSPKAVSLNENIYVILPSSTFQYTPETNTWNTLSPPVLKRVDPAVAVWYGKIVMCGGKDGNADSDDIQVYDPVRDTWAVKDLSLPRCLSGHTLINIPDYVIAEAFTFD